MDFLEDLRLVDGPVLWIAWAAGAAGLAYLLWHAAGAPPGRGRGPGWPALLLAVAVAVLSAAALLAGAHWLLIYVFSVFPGELPREVLAWSLPAVAALLLWLMRLWAPGGPDARPPWHADRRPARTTRCPRPPCWASSCSPPSRSTSTSASTTPSAT